MLAPPPQPMRLNVAVAALVAIASPWAASAAAGNCTFVADLDYSGGDVAPHVALGLPDGTRAARCCALCAKTPGCNAGVLAGATHSPPHACWLKRGGEAGVKSNPDTVSCWSDAAKVPPPGYRCNSTSWTCSKALAGTSRASCSAACVAPPAPAPQCYRATVAKFDTKPVISSVDGTSAYPQAFNPSWIEASAGTGGKAGLIIRTQNCSAKVGQCVACAGTGEKASVLTFAELLNSDNSSSTTPRFKPIDRSSLVFGPHDASDERGTEDPRVAYDSATGTYYMFYTCWASSGVGTLCLASTKNPTDTSGGIAGPGWTRHGSHLY